MSLYKYTAKNLKGKKVCGLMEAPFPQKVQDALKKQNLILLELCSAKESNFSEKIPLQEIVYFTKELAKLLASSLPLYDSLLALEEKYRKKKLHHIIVQFCDSVQSGASFSEALAKHPKIFDILYVSMVSNAEKTGLLANSLEDLSEILGKQLALKKQIVSTLTYPCILTAFCLVVLVSLFFFVIPSLADLFAERNVQFFTKIILSISMWLNRQKYLFFSACTLIMGGIVLGLKLPACKMQCRKFFLKAPLLGGILYKVALVRFCKALSSLLEGGVSFVDAIRSARSVMRHMYLEKAFEQVEKGILEGSSFSSELEKIPDMPSFVLRMVAIGEKSGNLPYILRQISEIQEEDLSRLLTQLTTIAQPVILLILGAIVGLVLLAVLLPLTDVSSFINT